MSEFKVKRDGERWVVVDSKGERIGPSLHNKDMAEMLRDKMEEENR